MQASDGNGSPGERQRNAAQVAELHRRVHQLVQEHMDSVWRSLRRLGVSEADCDDGCQRVWVVVAQKADAIAPDKVKSYIFSVILRVASEMRRFEKRHHHVELDEHLLDPAPLDPEGSLDQRRARALLDTLLSALSWDQRIVFVMFEIEGFSSPEIAEALGISRGTVASRLRLARDDFQRALCRYQARARAASEPLSSNTDVDAGVQGLP
jgi:RNA polymerase sigma-70 factor, ECF subfamily